MEGYGGKSSTCPTSLLYFLYICSASYSPRLPLISHWHYWLDIKYESIPIQQSRLHRPEPRDSSEIIPSKRSGRDQPPHHPLQPHRLASSSTTNSINHIFLVRSAILPACWPNKSVRTSYMYSIHWDTVGFSTRVAITVVLHGEFGFACRADWIWVFCVVWLVCLLGDRGGWCEYDVLHFGVSWRWWNVSLGTFAWHGVGAGLCVFQIPYVCM